MGALAASAGRRRCFLERLELVQCRNHSAQQRPTRRGGREAPDPWGAGRALAGQGPAGSQLERRWGFEAARIAVPELADVGRAIRIRVGAFLQRVANPLVDRLGAPGGGTRNLRVKFRRCAQCDLAGEGFLRVDAVFGAIVEIIIDAVVKRLHQILRRTRLESDDVFNADYSTVKDHVVLTEADRPRISLVTFQGVTPSSSRRARSSRTAQRLTEVAGCGRCSTSRRPRSKYRTRDPRPSLRLAPRAFIKLSTSRHATSLAVGIRKIASSVLLCPLFTANSPIHIRSHCSLLQSLHEQGISKTDIIRKAAR